MSVRACVRACVFVSVCSSVLECVCARACACVCVTACVRVCVCVCDNGPRGVAECCFESEQLIVQFFLLLCSLLFRCLRPFSFFMVYLMSTGAIFFLCAFINKQLWLVYLTRAV